jgi:phenylalanyl-tRNA synthetase beta chain
MKISLSWVFDHIATYMHHIDVSALIDQLSRTTAEVDGCEHVTIAWDTFYIGRVSRVSDHEITLDVPEINKQITIPEVRDCTIGRIYLLKKEDEACRWATFHDLQSHKDGMLPALYMSENKLTGAWREDLAGQDYILDIDNTSITNRPDLWGHRGFAREIAAIIGASLQPIDDMTDAVPVEHSDNSVITYGDVQIDIGGSPICDRFAGLHISAVDHVPSVLWMVARLARVDARAMNCVVDTTNYVMLDLSQPMHAFDADRLPSLHIKARQAREGEPLALLDGDTVELSSRDCVISSGNTPISLAGIMGGVDSSVQADTKALFIEAAHFDPSAIRATATRLQKVTESAQRFGKALDPNQNIAAIQRYVHLLRMQNITCSLAAPIVSVGVRNDAPVMQLAHQTIIDRIGCDVPVEKVQKILSNLDFDVQLDDGIWQITIPPFRATRDITIQADVIEEIARFIGFDTIPQVLPQYIMYPQPHTALHRKRTIKQYCAYTCNMREVHNYAFYDESFLERIGYDPQHAVSLRNPVSQQWRRMVTSLLPHLCKNVVQNHVGNDELRFFEWGKRWIMGDHADVEEHGSLAGIFYGKQQVDFYTCKQELAGLFAMLCLDVTWKKPTLDVPRWFDQNKTAELYLNQGNASYFLGYAGNVRQPWFADMIAEGHAFVFELSRDMLTDFERQPHAFQALPRYQRVTFDMSMLVPYEVAVREIEQVIIHADERIRDVLLIDTFEKDAWDDMRSVTIRVIAYDREKTMIRAEIDAVTAAVHEQLQHKNIEVR